MHARTFTRGATFNNGVDRSCSDSDGWGVGPSEPDEMTLPPMGSQPRDLGANHSTSRSNVTGGRAPGTISPSGNEWMGTKMEGVREGRATVGRKKNMMGGHTMELRDSKYIRNILEVGWRVKQNK